MRDIAAGMVDHIEGLEIASKLRQRRRRGSDQAIFVEIVSVVTANLAYAVLNPPQPNGRIAVRGGNPNKALTRYDNRPLLGKQLRPSIDMMHHAGFADFQLPPTRFGRNEVSSIAPTQRFAEMVQASRVSLSDFGRHPNEEVLRLTYWTGPDGAPYREPVDFRDTAETNAMRAAVQAINGFLANADIAFVDDGLRPEVDAQARRLTRSFQVREGEPETFDRVGRLFGGFWTNLSSHRRHGIRIDGEQITDLDYRSMFVRLAYAHVGKQPPGGDLYAIDGLEGYRSGVKLAINSLFWDQSRRRKSWPEELGFGVGTDADAKRHPSGPAAAFVGRLPAGWEDVSRLSDAILARHPELAPVFGRDVGGSLMFRESEIMMAVLADLMRQGVVALPLHDGIMVARSKARNAIDAMGQVAYEKTGLWFEVEVKVKGDTTHDMEDGRIRLGR